MLLDAGKSSGVRILLLDCAQSKGTSKSKNREIPIILMGISLLIRTIFTEKDGAPKSFPTALFILINLIKWQKNFIIDAMRKRKLCKSGGALYCN
jgi:hypothetical protein